jgi:hypothetical protein
LLDSKIQLLKNHFGIAIPTDWQAVAPSMVLSIDGIGPATLDYLRLCLAARNLTLRDDATPEHWKANLDRTKIGVVLSNEEFELSEGDTIDTGIINPFTILIDSAEEHAYTFEGLEADSDRGNRPLIVPYEWQCLGRHPDSLGDYAIKGHVGRCHVERKSMDDAHGTFLGWGRGGKEDENGKRTGVTRRERFECELLNLSQIPHGHVVIECSFGDLVANAPEWGKRTAAENGKTLFRTILAWQHRYPTVQWHFCADRRFAEIVTFRIFERFWQDEVNPKTRREPVSATVSQHTKQIFDDLCDAVFSGPHDDFGMMTPARPAIATANNVQINLDSLFG